MNQRWIYVGLFVVSFFCIGAILANTSKPKIGQIDKLPTPTPTPTPTPISVPIVEPEPVVELVAPVRKSPRNSALEAEYLSKISVSEGGFSRIEAQALLQALEDMREGRSLLDTMYGQCARVTKRKPYTDPRQVWVSNLPMKGSDMPEGWIECSKDENGKKTPKGCSGSWKSVASQWVEFRTYAVNLYWSGVVPSITDGRVVQWGGDMDYWMGAGRRFCPLRSDGTKNTFWGVPSKNTDKCLEIDQKKVERSRVLTAEVAAGRAARRHLIPN